MKPFLKWAGNKFRIVEQIKAVLPPGKRLIEPFVGSGAVFLNTTYDAYLLSDTNPDLIRLFQTLQLEGADFIAFCRPLFAPNGNSESVYYQNRELFNQTEDVRLKSALFVYLNKHCYNGLCRYNSRGEFNAPFGRYKRIYFPELEMVEFHQKAQQAHFLIADFVEVMASAQPGDVLYCDPPYVPLSETANFTSYSSDKFRLAQQAKLVQMAEQLAERGIPVVISNHDIDFTRQVYSRAEIHSFAVQRFISSNGSNRQKVGELLAVFKPVTGHPSPQGRQAARSGNTLEETVIGTLSSKGFKPVMYRQWQQEPEKHGSELLLRNVPYTTIYGHNGNTEFLLRSARYQLEVRIECKWQQSAGSVDEKLPYLFLNCTQSMPEKEVIIVVDGGGAKPGAIKWLREICRATTTKRIQVMNLAEFLVWANRTFR